MKKLILTLIIIVITGSGLSAQEFPYAAAGPGGIFVFCGKEIPRGFTYEVQRSGPGGDWKSVAFLKFESTRRTFYEDLIKFNSINPYWEIPAEANRATIWNFIERTGNTDSIPLYGTLPSFRLALGTAFYDPDVKRGESYSYKIIVSNADGRTEEKSAAPVLFAPRKPEIGLKNIYLSTEESRMHLRFLAHGKDIHSVRLFRQNYLQSDFEDISPEAGFMTRRDSVFYVAIDPTVQRKAIYRYFATPYDMYGNAGENSDTVLTTNMIDKSESYVQAIRSRPLPEENAVEITWRLDPPPFLRSVDIYKSPNYDSGYVFLASALPTDTSFKDFAVNPIETYFYYIVINGAYGRGAPSPRVNAMLTANRKAVAPAYLEAKAANNGVTLNWSKPSPDTRGYYLFRSSNMGGDSLIQITDIILTDSAQVSYTDSLAGANSPVLTYAVKSVNTSYDVSEFSPDATVVVAGESYPISAPLSIAALPRDGKILIQWETPDAQNYSVAGYKLYRRLLKKDGEDSTDLAVIATITDPETNYYEDGDVIEGSNYMYTVSSIGITGKASELSGAATAYMPAFPPMAIQSLVAARAENGVALNWNVTRQSGIKNYRVYRLLSKGAPTLLTELPSAANFYLDAAAPKDERCFYAVTCVNNKGSESKIDSWTPAQGE
ncbi:MAG: fibronectin type III domain-containing protein [Chloroflexota bacterium]